MWRITVILVLSIVAFICVLFVLYAKSRMYGWRFVVVCVSMPIIVLGCGFGIVSSANVMERQADVSVDLFLNKIDESLEAN